MPWNITASVQGSRQASSVARGRGFPGSIGGFPTSAAGPSSAPGLEGDRAGPLSRRTSRVTSASPLLGRGQERLSSLELPGRGDDDDDDYLGGRFVSDDQEVSDAFQLYGPTADVDAEARASASLDQDSYNFLEFVKAEIDNQPPPERDDELDVEDGGVARRNTVIFEELLPPTRHTRTVAASGLLHVLTLATKNLLNVQQREGFGPILINVVV